MVERTHNFKILKSYKIPILPACFDVKITGGKSYSVLTMKQVVLVGNFIVFKF